MWKQTKILQDDTTMLFYVLSANILKTYSFLRKSKKDFIIEESV